METDYELELAEALDDLARGLRDERRDFLGVITLRFENGELGQVPRDA